MTEAPVRLPDFVHDKLRARTFWQLVTINRDGSSTSTPVWVDVDGEHVVVNTAIGRLKERNARRDTRVTLAMVDSEDPYTWIQIRGRVVEFVEGEAADRSIDQLSNKYLGLERYATRRPGERRVILRIQPDFVNFKTEAGSTLSRQDPD